MNKTFSQNFVLRKRQTSSTIFLRLTVDGKRTEFSLQRECDPTAWLREQGRIKGKSEEVRSINTYLDAVEHAIYGIFQNFISSSQDFDGEKIKARYLGTDIVRPRMFLEVFEEHNQDFEKLVTNGQSSFRTLQKFRTVKQDVGAYLRYKYHVNDIEVDKIDYLFIKGLEIYYKTVKGCVHSSAMQYLKKVKKIVQHCVFSGWLARSPFVGIKISEGESERTFLTDDELKRIIELRTPIYRLELVRDMFLFSCYTGIAYCDMAGLNSTNIAAGVDGKKWISVTRTKTKTAARIPLLPVALNVLSKYENHPLTRDSGRLLPIMSNQKMNSYLKEIADKCGILKELTFHCARHTFATTVTLTNGVPLETVSKMLGHRSIKTTQLYGKVVDKKISEDMERLFEKLDTE